MLGIKDTFQVLAYCSSCQGLHAIDELATKAEERLPGNKKRIKLTPRKCSQIPYAFELTNQQRRSVCEEYLCEISEGGQLKPKHTFVYRSLGDRLLHLLRQPSFRAKIERWRQRRVPDDVLADVFDGSVWKSSAELNGKPFLSVPGNLALQLTYDQFQPYKRSSYSCGVFLVSILNLPREERYKRENVIVVAIVPGASKREAKKQSLEPYLTPLVRELQQLWRQGLAIEVDGQLEVKRAAVIQVTADAPAIRKLVGFGGLAGICGCHKCERKFKSVPNGVDKKGRPRRKTVYGNFCEVAPPRTHASICRQAATYRTAKTKKQQEQVRKQTGVTTSLLLDLEYFDAIAFVAIDIMHCLYLGLCKNAVVKFQEEGYLNDANKIAIQNEMDALQPPSDVPRIRMKIASNFARLKADEWRLFTTVYAEHVLEKYLPADDYATYLKLVNATRLLSLETISPSQAQLAHDLLIQYNEEYEELYLEKACKPNQHMSTHLIDTIRAFGPAPASWCYGFERIYGVLSAIPKNNKRDQMELTLMRSVTAAFSLRDQTEAIELRLEPHEKAVFLRLVQNQAQEDAATRTEEQFQRMLTHFVQSRSTAPTLDVRWQVGELTIPARMKPFKHELKGDERELLLARCTELFPGYSVQLPELAKYKTYKARVLGQTFEFTSKSAKSTRASYVLSEFTHSGGNLDTVQTFPGQIQYFLEVPVRLRKQPEQ
jgi:hypothetical protein